MQLEAKAEEQGRERQLIEQETYGPQGNGVPTATVQDREAVAEAADRIPFQGQSADGGSTIQHRKVDMGVWEASRRRVQEQDRHASGQRPINALQKEQERQDAITNRSGSEVSDAERERARLLMTQSPLSAFDVSYADDVQPEQGPAKPNTYRPQPRSGLNATFGRQVGPGEDWSPQEWQPRPSTRRRS